jgi:hypothetical protein
VGFGWILSGGKWSGGKWLGGGFGFVLQRGQTCKSTRLAWLALGRARQSPVIQQREGGRVFAEVEEGAEGDVVFAEEAGLVAGEGVEGVVAVGEGFEGEGEAEGFVEVGPFLLDAGALAGHLGVEEGGFGGPIATEAPTGGDELFEEVGFGGGGRREAMGVEVADVVEGGGFLVGEDEGAGGESVGEGVEGGDGFAGGGGGSAGFGAVEAGGGAGGLGGAAPGAPDGERCGSHGDCGVARGARV